MNGLDSNTPEISVQYRGVVVYLSVFVSLGVAQAGVSQGRDGRVPLGAVERRDHHLVVRMNEEGEGLTGRAAPDLLLRHSDPMNCRQVAIRGPELHQIADVDQNGPGDRRGRRPLSLRLDLIEIFKNYTKWWITV